MGVESVKFPSEHVLVPTDQQLKAPGQQAHRQQAGHQHPVHYPLAKARLRSIGCVEMDRVVVTGGASLGGSLVSSLVGGFVPQPTDQFQVMTFANRSGEFDLVEGATALYSATDVVLEQVESSDVGDPSDIPLLFALHPVRPNPSPVGTAIRYDLAQSTDVNLVVYDVSGRAVRTLLDGTNQAAGRYTADWDGLSDAGFAMPSGVYFYALETPQFSGTRRFVLLK